MFSYVYLQFKGGVFMNRIIFSVLFVAVILVISGCAQLAPTKEINNPGGGAGASVPGLFQTTECTDSDGGINYYERGHLEDPASNHAVYDDVCLTEEGHVLDSAKILQEFYCGEENYQYEFYICPNGCYNGACRFGTTMQEVLDMLENSEVHLAYNAYSCKDVCENYGDTCITAAEFVETNEDSSYEAKPCDFMPQTNTTKLVCRCASPI